MTAFDATTELLSELIAYPTVSALSNRTMIDHLANHLETAGARVNVIEDPTGAKANLFATIGPERDGGIVLSGHTDVVPVADQDWQTDPFMLFDKDEALYGRGTCDMKGFIAAAIALAPLLGRAATERPIHFAFTYDEETGCLGGQHLVETLREQGLRPALAIVGEPTSMRIIEGHKGCFEYTTHFTGFEGHGSNPDAGVNAVEYAVRYVNRLIQLKDQLRARAPASSRFDPPWTTINTGLLSGGVAHNVIPGKAQVQWEMRPVQATDADFVKRDLDAYCFDELIPLMRAVYPDADIVTEVIAEVDGLEPMDQNAARDLVAELTGNNGCDLVAFGTEAGLLQSLGMDVVVCGPGSIEQAHKPDEYLAKDQLAQCLTMLERLAPKLSMPILP